MTWTKRILAITMLLIAVVPGVHALNGNSGTPGEACASGGTDPSDFSVNPGYCAETGMDVARRVVG